MKILWIYFWGHHNWTMLRGNFYAFKGLFLKVKVQNGFFGGLLKFQIVFGVLEIPDIFWG